SLCEFYCSVRSDRPERIPRHLPRKTIWIGEITGVAAPRLLHWRLQDFRAGGRGMSEQRIDFTLRPDVVTERAGRAAERRGIGVEIGGELIGRQKRRAHA